MKKFFSISEARTVVRFLVVFLFHIGPAALLRSSGHFHPNSFLPSADVCCFLHEPFWFRPGFSVLICNSPLGGLCSWETGEMRWLFWDGGTERCCFAGASLRLLQSWVPAITPKRGSRS